MTRAFRGLLATTVFAGQKPTRKRTPDKNPEPLIERNWNQFILRIVGLQRHESLLIQYALGTIVVTGPKAWDFYDQFCKHKATLLKADGKDIIAVSMAINTRRGADDAE